MPTVLSIQSSVAHGHVGNAAAAFTLQRLGVDVTRIDTVRFSNHPAHDGFRGGPVDAAEIDVLIAGLDERGFLARADAALSGYLGTAANGGAVARAVERLKTQRPDAAYVCDPVMGDHPKGLFVAGDIPDVMRETLLPLATVLTPNLFELELLSGTSGRDEAGIVAAARQLIEKGPTLIVVTGVPAGERSLTTYAVTGADSWRVIAPRVDAPAYGAGDLFVALFLARYLEKADVPRALRLATSSVVAVLETTRRLDRADLAIVAAQETLAAPPRLFPIEKLD